MILFVDSNNNQIVAGVKNLTARALPVFTYQDTVPLTIYSIVGSTTSADYNIVPITGTLQAGIAELGSTTAAAYTQSFTGITDSNGYPAMSGTLFCGESAFLELINKSGARPYFCLRSVASEGGITTLLQTPVQIQDSALREAVTISLPISVTAPTLGTYTAISGSSVAATSGGWVSNYSPISLVYQWMRGAANITAATMSSYRFTDDDVGSLIQCKVTATNAAGSTVAYSNATTVILTANLVPAMTSNTTPSGVASCSTNYDSGHDAWYAFDHLTGGAVGWCSSGAAMPQWVCYQFTTAQIITAYSVQPVTDYDGGTRAPKTWTFEASNDGTTWTTLDTQTDAAAWSTHEARSFTFANTTAYVYYRLNVSATQGAAYLNIDELQMFA